MKDEQLLTLFIEWAKDCGEDAWYIFENTEEAIERFFKESKETKNIGDRLKGKGDE